MGSCGWQETFGQRLRPLPEASTLQELVERMMADGGYAGVDPQHLAVFAASPRCACGQQCTLGKAAGCLRQFGGDASSWSLRR